MASGREFAQYVADHLSGVGEIALRKMFGEYGIYCNGTLFALICDDRLFLKPTPAGQALVPGLPMEPPYEGAKPYLLVEDVDDRDTLCALAAATLAALPPPKPKRPRKKQAE